MRISEQDIELGCVRRNKESWEVRDSSIHVPPALYKLNVKTEGESGFLVKRNEKEA